MKTLIKFSSVFLVLNFSCVPPQREIPEESHSTVSFQVFYDELSPYGHWTRHPTLGYVWLPMDDPDFLPYSSHGHWVWTDYGWTWVSEYPWGWAPFHYGRWDYDPAYGWFWLPDNIWGPAWVVWREYPGYYGWAPLRPGIGITIVIGGGYIPPEPWWTFCHRKYFGRRDMRDHFEPRKKFGQIKSGESRIIDNTFKGSRGNQVFLTGPGRDIVQTETGEPVEHVTIESNNKPGESLKNNTWTVYHPEIERTPATKPEPVPKSVMTRDDVEKSKQVTSPSLPSLTPRREPSIRQPAPRDIPKQKKAPAPVPNSTVPNVRTPNQAVPKKDTPAQSVPRKEVAPKSIPKQESAPRDVPNPAQK
jgi:hypothetical protein